ncbi:MAG: flavodoxin [Christensenellales bacterium]|jgi:hypothetical protein
MLSELSAELFAAAEVTPKKMLGYDCIIFGGRLFATGIDGLSLIKKNFERLVSKRLIVFAAGASLPSETVLNEIKNNNLSIEQQSCIKVFYLRGGFHYNSLSLFDKLLLSLLKKSIMRKQRQGKSLTSDEAGMLELYEKTADFTKKEHIQGVLDAACMPF